MFLPWPLACLCIVWAPGRGGEGGLHRGKQRRRRQGRVCKNSEFPELEIYTQLYSGTKSCLIQILGLTWLASGLVCIVRTIPKVPDWRNESGLESDLISVCRACTRGPVSTQSRPLFLFAPGQFCSPAFLQWPVVSHATWPCAPPGHLKARLRYLCMGGHCPWGPFPPHLPPGFVPGSCFLEAVGIALGFLCRFGPGFFPFVSYCFPSLTASFQHGPMPGLPLLWHGSLRHWATVFLLTSSYI